MANAKHEVECGFKMIIMKLLSLLELEKDAGDGMQDRMQTSWVRLCSEALRGATGGVGLQLTIIFVVD